MRRARPGTLVPGLALAAALAPALAALPAAGQGFVVEGVDRARALAPRGAEVTAYDNVGYRLEVEGDEARIEVETSALESRAPFVRPGGEPPSAVARVAYAVTAGAQTEYDAISRVLGWVARNLDYDLDRSLPQSAEAVLERRSGYCTGVARLSVALLRAVGIPSREVAGYVLEGESEGEPSGYHRWIETYLSDLGWVYSDPLRSHHYVPATFVRLASEELAVEAGTEGLLLERHDLLRPSDLYPAGTAGITARRNTARRYAAALRVVVEDDTAGVAVLEDASVRLTHALVDGETTFVGLEPGRYQLSVLLPEARTIERAIEIPDRSHRSLFLPAGVSRRASTAPRAETTWRTR